MTRGRTSGAAFVAVLSAVTVLLLSPGRAAQAALIHDYELNGTFADSLGGPPMVSGGGTLGATGYTFAAGQGPNLSNAIPASNYSIEVGVALDDTSGYRKLIDFKNLTDDNGLYNLDTSLDFFRDPEIIGPAGAFANGVQVTVLLTRNGATGEVIGYVNGVQQFSFIDSAGDATFTAANNIIQFLIDDTQTGGREASGGFLDFVRIYDAPIGAKAAAPAFSTGWLVGAALMLLTLGVRRLHRNRSAG